MHFHAQNWCDLTWSLWIPLADLTQFPQLPSKPGMYRVRPVGQEQLAYIGQTGLDLRGRLRALRRGAIAADMPWDDPHTAAPSLWALHDAEGLIFECSAAPVDLSTPDRETLECYLLWQYRLAHGESTRCNHGRFHPRYVKSSLREKGIRGYRLPDGAADNEAGGPSMAPLRLAGSPGSADWMGLSWTTFQVLTLENVSQVPQTPGVYRLAHSDGSVIYLGESSDLRKRLRSHTRRDWQGETLFSFCLLPECRLSYQRHEVENDLIGAFWAAERRAPLFQFSGKSGHR